jgi:hypothetical protein
VWEILTEQLAKTSFEVRFVDAEQRGANEASIKRRYQWDPTKRRIWTSRCDHHQVVGYFNFYMHTQDIVGLSTEERFPVQVKLDELSVEDVRFVVVKLGHSMRGKVEVQLSAEQTVKVRRTLRKKNIRRTQTPSASATEQQGTDEGPKFTLYRRFPGFEGSCYNEDSCSTRESRRLLNEVRQQREQNLTPTTNPNPCVEHFDIYNFEVPRLRWYEICW